MPNMSYVGPVEGVWTPRYALASASASLYAVFAGGILNDLSSSNVVETVKWTSSSTVIFGYPFLSVARGYLASATLGNLILFAGGQTTSSGSVSNRIDFFDATTGAFTATASLSVARSRLAAVSVPTLNVILFAGGSNGTQPMNTIDMWNASSGSITQPTGLPIARHSLCAAAIGSRVFFAGGRDSGALPTDVVEILDLTTMQWSNASVPLSDGGRAELVCSSFATGVLFAGGVGPTSISNAVDVYVENGTKLFTTPPPTTITATTAAPSATSTPAPSATSTPAPSTPAPSTPVPTVSGGCEYPPPLPSAFCNNSVWVIPESIVVNSTTTIETPTPTIVVGNVTITTGSTLNITALNISGILSIITATDCIRIDSNTTLVLDLGKTTLQDGQKIKVFEASQNCGGVLGNFSSVQTTGGTLRLCESLSASQITSSTQLAVLLSVGKSSCRKKSNKVAIITGCAIGGAVLLVSLVILFYYATYVKRWIKWFDRYRLKDNKNQSGASSRPLAPIDTN